MLGVSLRTIENRFAEYNMTNVYRYSDIDDGSLDIYVQRTVANFPRSGEYMQYLNVENSPVFLSCYKKVLKKTSRNFDDKCKKVFLSNNFVILTFMDHNHCSCIILEN